MSIKGKIILPVVMIAAAVLASTVFSSFMFTRYTDILFEEKIAMSANILKNYLNDCKTNSRIAAITSARDPEFISVIETRDREKIYKVLLSALDLYSVDFFAVTDETGKVLVRSVDYNSWGDSIVDQENVLDALHGSSNTYLEKGVVSAISIRTGAPVYNADGVLIGVISTGMRLDSNEMLDILKEHYGIEYTVFVGDTRVASTVFHNGERNIGTKLDPFLVNKIINGKEETYQLVNLYGEDYSAFYMPIFNSSSDVYGVFFAGQSVSDLLSKRTTLFRNNILIGFSGILFSIIMMLFFVGKISVSIKNLGRVISEVTRGNMDINLDRTIISNDEIGVFTKDVFSFVNVIRSTINDLSHLTNNLAIRGDSEYKIDSSKYQGSYREIITGIQELGDSVSLMRKTAAAMDYLDTMISVSDFNYNLVYVNRSMAEKYNLDLNNYAGKKCYRTIRGLDRPCSFCQMQNLLPERESYPIINYNKIYDEKAGMYIGGNVAIIQWVDGAQVFFNSIKDETKEINYQKELHEALDAAKAASVAKSMFIANMSHEIRTPMNSVIGFSELAMDSDISPKTRNYLNMINENSKWLMRIINDILDISKVESGNMKLEIIPFDLRELFNSCKSIVSPKAIEKNICLSFHAEASVDKYVLGDPMRLRQVFVNLLSNAIKFTDTGCVRLIANIASTNEDNITLQFEIRDTGIGMTAEQIKNIFDPFVQADISTTRKYGGTGLGLTIARKIIALMGSELKIESEPGIGTNISFTLAFRTTDKNFHITDTENAATIKKPRFRGKVLVCEDNLMNQRVVIEHMEKVGLEIDIAENGLEGIDKVRNRIKYGQKPYDLIFMDIHMPVMDGIDAAREILKLETGTPIIAMTANIMVENFEKYRALGMTDCIGKPFTSQDLWRCLLKFLKPLGDLRDEQIWDDSESSLQKQLKMDFITGNQNIYSEITGSINTGNIALAHRLAHTLKSNAGLLGKTVLQNAASDVEASLKDGINKTTAAQMDLLNTELAEVLNELSPYRIGEPESLQPEIPSGNSTAAGLIEKLEPLLRQGNPECLKYIGELKKITGSEKIIQQIENFYFNSAAELLAELKEKMPIAGMH